MNAKQSDIFNLLDIAKFLFYKWLYPFVFQPDVMDSVFVSPENLCVEALTPHVIVFGSRAFGEVVRFR